MKEIFTGCFAAVALFFCGVHAGADEEQAHGVFFERKVIDQLLERSYTAEWDIPAEGNRSHPGVPVSIKFIQVGRAVYFGDALRQRAIDRPFDLVIGFYKPDAARNVAMVHGVYVISVDPDCWRALWGKVTRKDLEELRDAIHGIPLEDAQKLAKERAGELRALSNGMKINPKVNADQRRIQCSMDYEMFCEKFLDDPDPPPQSDPVLWGKPFPHEISLGKRVKPLKE